MTATETIREHPLLMSTEMILARRAGRKTQTRRIITNLNPTFLASNPSAEQIQNSMRCPYGRVGDRLWIREAWAKHKQFENEKRVGPGLIFYAADGKQGAPVSRWHSSIHMPRWACRDTPTITAVRAERVQDIGKDGRKANDVLAEGITAERIEHYARLFHSDDAPAIAFAELWNSINGKCPGCSWADNPWVWVIEMTPLPGVTK